MPMDTDFLGNKFIIYKCSRCRKEHRAMEFSLGTRTCPTCSNENLDVPLDPDKVNSESYIDILTALDYFLLPKNKEI